MFTILFAVASYHHDLYFYTPSPQVDLNFPVEADFSALQAEAFLNGNLYVRPTPTELLALEDPYDPVANIPMARCCGYHDLAFYNGKIFAPQGFGTSLLIDVPTRLIGLGYANPPLKILILTTVGSWCLIQLIFVVRRSVITRAFSTTEVLLVFVTTVLANPASWLVVAGRPWQVAVAGGYAGISAGAFLLIRAVLGRSGLDTRKWSQFSIGASALLLGVIARPPLAPLAFFVLLVLVGLIARIWGFNPSVSKLYMALIVPICGIVAFWFWFNFARFGNILETGHQFQLSGFNMRLYPIGSFEFVPANLKMYLATMPQLGPTFPFFDLAPNTTVSDISIQGHERLVGLATAYPVLIASPFALLFAGRKVNAVWLTRVGVLVILPMTTSLIMVSYVFKDTTMRYMPDFSVGLTAVCALSVSLFSSLQRPKKRWGLIAVWLFGVCLLWTFTVSISLLFQRCIQC